MALETRQLVRKGGGRDYDYSMDHCFVKLASESTGGELSLVEDALKPGFTLARHHHKRMTEVFYILEGEVEFAFDDETVLLGPGDTLTIPPNVWHAAACRDGGRMLTIFKDGRFDDYLERLSTLSEAQFQDEELMRSLSEEFDIFER
ncbi:MAG: cupin domain-containing protein [Acidobacteriota bacterium]